MFTDIEGSTARWEQHPDVMAGALARHDAILRGTIERHGGHVFKTGGDAFYAVFTTVREALAAALEAQRALAAPRPAGAAPHRSAQPPPLKGRGSQSGGASPATDESSSSLPPSL